MRSFFTGAFFAVLAVASVANAVELVARTGGGIGKPPPPFACPKYCKFPPHSTPKCELFNPCGFTCTDGYAPFPIILPVKCVCAWPYTECNGKCGIHKACPSKGHSKRDLTAADANCPVGYTACGILGRATGSWECINTQRDLESCGGCLVSVTNELDKSGGQDCTAIDGVSDVACVQGSCLVRKCMPGYEVGPDGKTCDAIERQKTSIFSIAEDVLAAEYGLKK
ncbi:hypothetical protein MD484_g7140, partial [Candolleomyces efflorescens]